MTIATGTVEQISEKAGQYGPMISYKINGEWYLLKGSKFKQRDVTEGTFVDVEFETNARGYKDIVKGGLKVSTAPKPSAPAGKAAVPYQDPRQDIISKQAALNTALTFCTLAHSAGVLPAFGNAKANDKLSLLCQWWLEEAARSYELSTGKVWELPEVGEEDKLPERPKKAAAKKAAPPAEEDSGTNEWEDDDIPY